MNSKMIRMAVVGNPIAHSLSPNLFNHWANEYNLNISYKRIFTNDVEDAINLSSNLRIDYLNVTAPFKNQFFKFAEKRDLSSYVYFAVNFFNCKNKSAFNFDAIGLSSILSKNNISLKEKKILIIGAGDTASLIIDFIKQFKNNEISIYNRTINKAKKLSHIKRVNFIEKIDNTSGFDVIFSTIPDFREMINQSTIRKDAIVIDLNYSIKKNDDFQFKYFDGLHWLIYQAMPVMIMLYQTLPHFDETYNYLSEINNLPKNNQITLIGFSGSGKSSIGKELANRMNFDLYDTDEIIENYTGLEIPLIFEKYGVDYFRNLEAKVLEYFAEYKNVIIATGGGIIENQKSINILKNYNDVIYIYSDLEQSLSRINIDSKPILKNSNNAEIENLFTQRSDKYFEVCNSIIYNNHDIDETIKLIYENYR